MAPQEYSMKRVLITGATGFIGCRLAEVACSRDLAVVGMVHKWSQAARLSRLPVQMVHGDVLDPDSLRESMNGCDVVFHCAVDNRIGGKPHRLVSVQGTANVLQLALQAGVQRVIHLSSVAVYSYQPRPDAATEAGQYRYSGDVYCDAKIDSEKTALRYGRDHGLQVVVLRPTIVYGPFGFHSELTATLVRNGRMVLVDGGSQTCNSLYVDNLVDAMLVAARHPAAPGQVFHISDADTISWKEFIEAHARAIMPSRLPLPEMTTSQLEQAWAAERQAAARMSTISKLMELARDPNVRATARSIPWLRRSVQWGRSVAHTVLPASARRASRKTVPDGHVPDKSYVTPGQAATRLLSKSELGVYTTFGNMRFSTDKARRVLGFKPEIVFKEGMRRTAAWLQWAGL